MKRASRLVATAALVWFLASPAQAQSVIIRSYVPNWSYLASVEHGRMETLLSQSLAIPDSAVQPLLNAQVAAEADKFDKSGHVTCTGDCPDYDWQVDATGSFATTTIRLSGSAGPWRTDRVPRARLRHGLEPAARLASGDPDPGQQA